MPEATPIKIMGAGLSGLAAATIIARSGRAVEVYDIRDDSGARFDGDFQALENWSMPIDFFDQLKEWGFNPEEFKSTDFKSLDLIHPDDEITTAKSDSIAFRIVERGTSPHTIDQGFKRMAEAEGVQIHYKTRINEDECDIIATGPKGTSAVAYGEIFHTNHPNKISFQLNDKLAPGAYSYLIIIDGVGLICTCLWRKQKKSERFLNETVAWYQKQYPEIQMKPVKRVGGKGDFTINKRYKDGGKYFVGESGGLQDFMWGFGMRMAVWSGVLAAKDIVGECDYDQEIRKHLMPYVKTSIANRFLMNRVGDRMFKLMCNRWMKHQTKSGDGLIWIGKLFKPSLLKSSIYVLTSPFMLKKDTNNSSRNVRRLPFRKAKSRDNWDPSKDAIDVGKRWEEIRRKGAAASFKNDSDAASIPSK